MSAGALKLGAVHWPAATAGGAGSAVSPKKIKSSGLRRLLLTGGFTTHRLFLVNQRVGQARGDELPAPGYCLETRLSITHPVSPLPKKVYCERGARQ